MPAPRVKKIPDEAGYPGMPINDAQPDVKKAWEYFNEEVRPRRVKVEGEDGKATYSRVEEGAEDKGELYPIWTTGPWDLIDFGLGVAMYFQTLQLLIATFLLCYLSQMGTISYYKSDEYSSGQADVKVGMLVGSAVCTDRQAVCLDEACEDWSSVGLHNKCTMGDSQAGADFTMTVLLLLMFTVVAVVQNKASNKMDESKQTAQDYSVMVDDPGPMDDDPEKWREFFSQFGHVTFITIARDNGPLLRALANRRALMREIMMKLGNGEASLEEDDDGVLDMTWEGMDFSAKLDHYQKQEESGELKTDGLSKRRAMIEKFGLFGMKPIAKFRAALKAANEKLQEAIGLGLESGNFKVSKIFVTFETEHGQRKCLKALTRGLIPAYRDKQGGMEDKYVWNEAEGKKNVLAIKEAPEPSEVFWEDVDVMFQKRVVQQTKTFFIVVFLVVGSTFVCKGLANGVGAGGAALWITIANIIMPVILRKICTEFEDHVSANEQNMSLFLKLTFFRWCNTAIVIYFITDFDEFLTEKAIKQVQAVILADAITSPLIRTLNPADLINQLMVCKYAITQEKMNSYFLGTIWYPAERYADMTKTLFLSLFFSALFPFGLFLTCFGYTFIYVVDKYSLLRSWRTDQQVDDDMTKISRMHMTFAVYVHAVMSMVFYSEFPFDGVCPNTGPLNDKTRMAPEDVADLDDGSVYLLPTTLKPAVFQHARVMFNVTTDQIYHACDQSVGSRLLAIIFVGDRVLENPSSTGQQERAVRMYGVLVVTLTVILFIAFFGKGLVMGLYNLFYAKYTGDGSKATDVSFTDCDDILAYVPKIDHETLAYPLIAVDPESLNDGKTRYLPFQMKTEADYKVQNLYNPNELPGFTGDEMKALFSSVTFFEPPAGLKEEPLAPPEKPKKKSKKGDKGGDYEAV